MTFSTDADVTALNTELRELTNGVVGFKKIGWDVEGVRVQYHVDFNCEHDIVIAIVFPVTGEPFTVRDYGYFPEDTKTVRTSVVESITAYGIWSLASENEDFPFRYGIDEDADGAEIQIEDAAVNVKAAKLVLDFLAAAEPSL